MVNSTEYDSKDRMSFGELHGESLSNPFLRQIVNLRNKYDSLGLAFQPCGVTNYSQGSHTDHSDGGGCYVTTACLDSLGLSRDSLEMKAMKVLTNVHVLGSFSGKRDYITYQKKGPRIVSAINSRDDSKSIWQGVYEKIGEVTQSILSEDYAKGHKQYKDLILGLEAQFA
jgi:hypothetical protein